MTYFELLMFPSRSEDTLHQRLGNSVLDGAVVSRIRDAINEMVERSSFDPTICDLTRIGSLHGATEDGIRNAIRGNA